MSSVAVPVLAASAVAAWIDGPVLWLLALLLALAAAAATAGYLEPFEPLGVPVEVTLLAAVASVVPLGLVHVAGQSPLAVLGVVAGGLVLVLALAAERSALAAGVRRRDAEAHPDVTTDATAGADAGEADARPPELLDPASGPERRLRIILAPRDRAPADWRLLAVTYLVGFAAFAAILGLTDRGYLPRLPAAGAPGADGGGQFLVIVVGCGLVAASIGYRTAALDGTRLVGALWRATLWGTVGAAGVTALRGAELAVAGWAGMLTAVVYLWGVAHRVLDRVRPRVRVPLELLMVGGAATIIAVWHLHPEWSIVPQ